MCRAIVLILLVSSMRAADAAAKRVALVIGNSAYTEVAGLPNPRNDAELMSRALSDVGFEVITVTDADRRTMGRAIQDFGRALRAAGMDAVGVFYYAGHGVQSRGQNYLLPLNAKILDEADLDLEAISASDVLSQMEGAGNALNLVILDACRDNPFARLRGSLGRGLGRVDAASGSLVAFAAAPGESAADGDGANSPYTSALAAAIREPGLSIEQMFKRVRIQVRQDTAGRQTPWEESSLLGDFFFVPGAPETAGVPPDPGTISDDASRMAWDAVRDTRSREVLEAFLKEYQDGVYAALAMEKLKEITREQTLDGVRFANFDDLSRFTLNGVAADLANDNTRNGALRLTNALYQGGSAFLDTRISIAEDASFSTYFSFRMTNPMGLSDDVMGADGLVYIIQLSSSNVEAVGGGIGYDGLAPSLGIEFDTWWNVGEPDGNHVGIDLDGNMNSVVARHVDTPFNNGEIWHAWVDYDGHVGRLEVRWSSRAKRPRAAMLTHEIDLMPVLHGTDVFLGFSSGTGAAGNTHDILSWQFFGKYDPIRVPVVRSID